VSHPDELDWRCPACYRHAPSGDWWTCPCGERCDPFREGEVETCLACGEEPSSVTCPDCGRTAPAQAWHPLAGIEWMRDEGAGTIDVVLPLERAPRFPDLCVACGEDPSQRLTLVVRASRGGDWLRVWGGGGRRLRLEVPCCERCAGRVRWLPRLRVGLGWLVFLGAGLATLVIARERGARLASGAGLGVLSGAVALVVYLLTLARWWKVPLDVHADQDRERVVYELSNPQVALHFALVNEAERVRGEKLSQILRELSG